MLEKTMATTPIVTRGLDRLFTVEQPAAVSSSTVMQEQDLTKAITSDKHFIQAGFRALLLETS